MEVMVEELRNHPEREPLAVVVTMGELGEALHEQAVRGRKARQSEVMRTLR